MKRSIRTALVVLCSIGMSGAALAESSTSQTGNLPVPQDAHEVLNELHQANQQEIKLAQMALQKGQSQQVKQLAQTILNDHQQADQQIQQLAKQMKMTLSEPKEKGNIHDKLTDLSKDYKAALTAVQGQPFDQLYTTDMVLDHDRDVATLSAARENLKSNQQLTQLLDQLLPKLDQHRQMALSALQSVQPKVQQGVGGSGQ